MEPMKIKYIKIAGAIIKGDFTLTKPPEPSKPFELSGEFILRDGEFFLRALNSPSGLYNATCYTDNNLTCGIEADFFIDCIDGGKHEYGEHSLYFVKMSSSGQITCFNNAHALSLRDEIKALFKWW